MNKVNTGSTYSSTSPPHFVRSIAFPSHSPQFACGIFWAAGFSVRSETSPPPQWLWERAFSPVEAIWIDRCLDHLPEPVPPWVVLPFPCPRFFPNLSEVEGSCGTARYRFFQDEMCLEGRLGTDALSSPPFIMLYRMHSLFGQFLSSFLIRAAGSHF